MPADKTLDPPALLGLLLNTLLANHPWPWYAGEGSITDSNFRVVTHCVSNDDACAITAAVAAHLPHLNEALDQGNVPPTLTELIGQGVPSLKVG